MDSRIDFPEIEPRSAAETPTAAQVSNGIPVPPVRLLQVMSAEDWEGFTEEWLSFHKGNGSYVSVRRYSGPGDFGLDVVAFVSASGFDDDWDSFQCKQYDHPLQPGDIYGEIGKIIYHSFQRTPPFNNGNRMPRRHVFVCPHGVGITVGRWLKDPKRFKEEVREKWESHCVPAIGKNISAPLEGELLNYFDEFDFAIFEDRTAVELIEEHAQTIFHAARFGGGLPPRGASPTPPAAPTSAESLYLQKLFAAYGDHLGATVEARENLDQDLIRHYDRQRELFYNAESLRNFARDRTPPNTFASLQEDVFHGVIDVCEAAHQDGLARLRNTIATAAQVDVSGNALVSVTKVADKQGICHQLANENRLDWVKKNG